MEKKMAFAAGSGTAAQVSDDCLTDDLFERVGISEQESEKISRESVSYWKPLPAEQGRNGKPRHPFGHHSDVHLRADLRADQIRYTGL